jgi:hypothetical protein
MDDEKFPQMGVMVKKKEFLKHKKTIQKVGTIGLIPHKVPKRSFFRRWC